MANEAYPWFGTIETAEVGQSGKSWSVKVRTQDGQIEWLRLNADKTPPPEGHTVQGTYTLSEYNGKQYKWIKNWGLAQPGGVGQPPQQPTTAAAPPRPAPPAMPARAPHDDAREEGMFVMGVVGRAMGSGHFEVNDISLLTKAAVEAWRDRHSAETSGYPGRTQTHNPYPTGNNMEPPPHVDDPDDPGPEVEEWLR